MTEFIKNLLPRVQKFSKELDVIEVFVDKPWIYLDISGNHHEYVFMRDGRLLMSLNGTVIEGKWELLPTKRLLINRVVDQVMLNKMFINKDILMLQKNGTEDDPFVLINQDEIKDLNYLSYFKNLEEKLINEEENINKEPRITKTKKVVGLNLMPGMVLKTENNILMSGTFSHINNENKIFEIINNKIESIYYFVDYTCWINGIQKKIKLSVSIFGVVQKGDRIINEAELNLPINEFFQIVKKNYHEFNIMIDSDFIITKAKDNEITEIFIGIALMLLIIIVIIFSVYF